MIIDFADKITYNLYSREDNCFELTDEELRSIRMIIYTILCSGTIKDIEKIISRNDSFSMLKSPSTAQGYDYKIRYKDKIDITWAWREGFAYNVRVCETFNQIGEYAKPISV